MGKQEIMGKAGNYGKQEILGKTGNYEEMDLQIRNFDGQWLQNKN